MVAGPVADRSGSVPLVAGWRVATSTATTAAPRQPSAKRHASVTSHTGDEPTRRAVQFIVLLPGAAAELAAGALERLRAVMPAGQR